MINQNFETLIKWKTILPKVSMNGVGHFSTRANPVIAGQLVLVSSFSPGFVTALKKSNGDVVWQTKLDSYGNPLLVYKGVIYTHSARSIYAIELKTGKTLWKRTPYREVTEQIYSHPTVYKSRVFFGDRNGYLHCLDRQSGKTTWRTKISEKDVNSTADVVGDLVVVGTNDGNVVAVDKKTGAVRWTTKINSKCIMELVHLGESIFVSANNVLVIDATTGVIERKIKGLGETTPIIVVDKKAFAVTRRNSVLMKNGTQSKALSRLLVIRPRGPVKTKSLKDIYAFGVTVGAVSGSLLVCKIGGFAALD
ncbi:MAG: hypothetical protein EOP06_18805, partial [Proteobacteria bacterium]